MAAGSGVTYWSSRRAAVPSLTQSVDIAFAYLWQLAAAIESDPSRIEEWYCSVRIRELGNMTAQELVVQDNTDLVIGFLRSISCGERD